MSDETILTNDDIEEEPQEAALVRAAVAPPANSMTAAQMERAIEEAERKAELQKRMIAVLVKSTYPSDWCIRDGKAGLVSWGAERIAARVGVCYRDMRTLKETFPLRDGSLGYRYVTSAIAEFQGVALAVEGIADTTMKFFAVRGGKPIPIDEISEANIRRSSRSKCILDGVARLLGIRCLPASELEKYGVTWAGSTTIEYKSNKKPDSASAPAPDGRHEDANEVISEKQRKLVYAKWKAKSIPDEQVKAWLKEEYGIDRTEQIPRTEMDAVLAWIEAWKPAEGGPF